MELRESSDEGILHFPEEKKSTSSIRSIFSVIPRSRGEELVYHSTVDSTAVSMECCVPGIDQEQALVLASVRRPSVNLQEVARLVYLAVYLELEA